MDLPAAQRSLARIGSDLRDCARRLQTLRQELADPDDVLLEAMEQGERPFDATTLIIGAVDCALNEWLPRAAGELEKAAAVTQEELDAEWRATRCRDR